MTFFEAREKFGISHLPDFLADYYEDRKYDSFITREALTEMLDKFEVQNGRDRLFAAIDAIEADEELHSFSGFVVEQSCAQRNRLDGEHINVKGCDALGEFGELYPMLILISCGPVSTAACLKRGIPEEAFAHTRDRMIGGALRGYDKGRTRVSFAWQANFATCALYQFGRFYFVPHRYDAEFRIFKNKESGQALALINGGIKIRPEDGQYDGIEKFFSENPFTTVSGDTDEAYVGNVIHPEGRVLNEVATLKKSEWEETVKEGDCFLALHIPGGPGYDPEHFREATLEALAFYEKYFPDMPVRGIWSESWLYDEHLRQLLPEKSGIIRMQDQMYIAPFRHGHASIHGELHHKEPLSSLELAVKAYEEKGGTFASEFMFILAEDAERIGDGKLYNY